MAIILIMRMKVLVTDLMMYGKKDGKSSKLMISIIKNIHYLNI